jgi:hypothetical protein
MLFREIIPACFENNKTHKYEKIRDIVKAGETTLQRQ